MTNLHEITLLVAKAFGFEASDDEQTQALVGELLASLLEQLVTRSFSYLSTEDQQILDGMMDADASADDVLGFLGDRVPDLQMIAESIISTMKTEADSILAMAAETDSAAEMGLEVAVPELSPVHHAEDEEMVV